MLTVAQGARVNQEQDARKTGAVLPSKGDQNINKPTPTDSAKTEQQLPKNKITLSSLRDFSLEPIFSRWYRYDSSSIFRKILTEFGIKINIDGFVKKLYSAAEIIDTLEYGEMFF